MSSRSPKRLSQLLSGCEVEFKTGPDPMVCGVEHDSRRICPGDVFVCLRGQRHDGHRFVPQAVDKGAVAVVSERRLDLPSDVALVVVPDSRRALAWLAAAVHDHPSKGMRLIGVTGTNGKSTTVHLVRTILERTGRPCGLVGTVHRVVGGTVLPADLTTPEAPELQRLLAGMLEAGCSHAVMEVSSQALAVGRVATCEFDVAVFTNLTYEHMELHGTFDEYRKAKGLLFQHLGTTYWGSSKDGPKAAVLNADDPSFPHFRSWCAVPVVAYGLGDGCQVRGTEVKTDDRGRVTFRVNAHGHSALVRLRLAGTFNVYNALAALAVALVEGLQLEEAVEALEYADPVPGRFEYVDAGQPFAVIVDYAHSPNGLENVLQAARGLARGRVLVVFGCGGDRDPSKRPIMGEIAGALADLVVVTSDNPRHEDPHQIMADIEEGLKRTPPREGYRLVEDRREAIRTAIRLAREGDVVLIAGKGHETTQIYGDRALPFDDRRVAREVLAEVVRGKRE